MRSNNITFGRSFLFSFRICLLPSFCTWHYKAGWGRVVWDIARDIVSQLSYIHELLEWEASRGGNKGTPECIVS